MADPLKLVEKQLKAANERIAILRTSVETLEATVRQKTDELNKLTAELNREKKDRAERLSLALDAALAEQGGAKSSLMNPENTGKMQCIDNSQLSILNSQFSTLPVPSILLVDGHNTLCGLLSRYNKPTGRPATDTKERHRFVSDVARAVEHTPAIRVRIVFDGPTHSETAVSQNVHVIYSGGTGEHRADKTLLDSLRFYQNEGISPPRILVSDDAKLRDAALQLDATLMTARQFGKSLR